MITVKKNDKGFYDFCLWKHWDEKIYCDEDELKEYGVSMTTVQEATYMSEIKLFNIKLKMD